MSRKKAVTRIHKVHIEEVLHVEMSEKDLIILKKRFLGWHRIILPVLAYFVFAGGLVYKLSSEDLSQGTFLFFLSIVGISIGFGIFSFIKSVDERKQALEIIKEAEERIRKAKAELQLVKIA